MPVKVRETKPLGERYGDKRRGHRMNSRVPVRLEWDGDAGKRFSVEAHTRVVNPYGCMVVLEQELQLEHRLALTNLATDTSNAAVVRGSAAGWLGVWRRTRRAGDGFLGA